MKNIKFNVIIYYCKYIMLSLPYPQMHIFVDPCEVQGSYVFDLNDITTLSRNPIVETYFFTRDDESAKKPYPYPFICMSFNRIIRDNSYQSHI